MKQIGLCLLCLLLVTVTDARNRKVKIITSKGNIVVKLSDKTPLHRNNFIKLVKQRYYNGILFHRVIKEFMIQAGDDSTKQSVPGKHYGNGGLKRMGGRKIPERYRQVYKTVGGAPHLDQNYTVFGEVVKGMQVVDTIAQLERDQYDRPKEDVRIIRMKLKKKFLFF